MEVILRASDGWESLRIPYARTFWQRWRGMSLPEAGDGLLLKTKSVHGRGINQPILAVALSESFEVLGSNLVERGRFVRFPAARYILELPASRPGPEIGSQLTVSNA